MCVPFGITEFATVILLDVIGDKLGNREEYGNFDCSAVLDLSNFIIETSLPRQNINNFDSCCA